MQALPSELWADLIGKKYAHLARGPEIYDCYGLVLEITRRRGIKIDDVPYADTLTDKNATIIAHIKTEWRKVEVRPGAVLVFGMTKMATHCGVAIDQDRFIHASEDYKTTLVSRLDGRPPFRRWLIGAYEHINAKSDDYAL
jgi:cell wall-associated NlpC family hydrolase